MDDFHLLSKETKKISDKIDVIRRNSSELTQTNAEQRLELGNLEKRLSSLFTQMEESMPEIQTDEYIAEINDYLFIDPTQKTDADKAFDLNKVDVIVACIAGGLAVLVDFLIVKVPKDMKFNNSGKSYHHDGSPLTNMFRKIGVDENGNEAKWIQTLEKWFHVNYDKSTGEKGSGMYPKNHRVFSLAHDPSIIGLIWGIRDIACGTFSYIDKSGILHIEKVAPADISKIFYAPVLWLGHIISDIFTSQGIPIPGTCILRTLRIGSLGDKDRTIGEIVEYMYVQGYDLRHLATMSTCRLVINVVIKLYCFLIAEKKPDNTLPLYEQEYIRVKNEEKKRKLMFLAYSIAVAGNIGKVAAYQGNPLAINAAIWYQFAREAISQIVIHTNDNKPYMDAIENRHMIDETFEQLLHSTSCEFPEGSGESITL